VFAWRVRGLSASARKAADLGPRISASVVRTPLVLTVSLTVSYHCWNLVDSHLKFDKRISEKVSKAYMMLGILRRNFKDERQNFTHLVLCLSVFILHYRYHGSNN